MSMRRRMYTAIGMVALVSTSTTAQVTPFPASFKSETISTNGAGIFVRVGGKGPAVVLLHGFGESGDMWAPLAARLVRDHTVIVPDLRGMGLSSHPADGYDKKTQAADIAGVLDTLHVRDVALVTHDIGNMVGFAFAAAHSDRVTKFALLDAPVPGVGPWDDILKSPLLWHFHFGGPDMERLVKGRERIYLDRFWNEFSADRTHWDEASRQHYAQLYARDGAMHSAFEQFKAFDQDAIDNRAFLSTGRLSMPILAIGGAKSFGPTMAVVMRAAAPDVQQVVVPNSGHWLMEENPAATMDAIEKFLTRAPAASQESERRLSVAEIGTMPRGGAGAGTSGVDGITTTVLSGDPTLAQPYTIEIRVPAHTRIAAHSHRDDRSAVVISGTWWFGYGSVAADSLAKPLPAGSFYTEPAGRDHFAVTRDQPAVVYITGFGPTDTHYVAAGTDPRRP
jgi:pimeloyl-ACP methyl ester carboxylesterase/quercetin dioxygenase-like cupin family protein